MPGTQDLTMLPPVTAVPVPAASDSALSAYFRRLSEAFGFALAQSRPWSELADRSAFSRPLSVAEATGRIRKNWAYFRTNYVLTLLAVTASFLLAHPLSLLTLCALLGVWAYFQLFHSGPLVVSGREYSEREVFALLSVLSVIVVFFLTDVGSLLISGLAAGVALVAAHGAFRAPDDLFLDDQESSAPLAFLPFLLPRPSSVPPTLAVHV